MYLRASAVLTSFAVIAAAGCGSASDAAGSGPDARTTRAVDAAVAPDASSCDVAAEALRAALDSATTDADFTLLLRTAAGREFVHSVGMSTPTTAYESASTSKWVAATIILRQVDRGRLSLDDHPQKYLAFWPTDAADPLARITLRDLLSFTSGLEQSPVCVSLPNADFSACVQRILEVNQSSPVEPATGFFYGNAHLQVAGLMAVSAASAASWSVLFSEFQQSTGLFANGVFDLPSSTNPRLAGGMHWRGQEYLDFVEAVYRGELLSPDLAAQVLADHVGELPLVMSPIAALQPPQQWHYGFGFWLECSSPVYDCEGVTRISSPGAYGAYPLVDFEQGYMGVLARQGEQGSFRDGYALFDLVRSDVQRWVACAQ